jgi:hypothetical protein
MRAHNAGRTWLVRNVLPDGRLPYLYDVRADTFAPLDNEVRQLMASRLLAELAIEDSTLRPLHRRNLQYVMTTMYRETPDGSAYILFEGKSKLGGLATAVRTIVASPSYEDYEPHAIKLSVGILSLMEPNGAFRPWFVEPPYAYDADYLLTFYSGEAILALLEIAERSGQHRFFDAATRAQEYYLIRYVHEIDANYYPAYVPWHTLSLAKLYRRTQDRRYADAAFVLNDKLIEIQDTVLYPGRFFNWRHPEFGNPHAASDGVYMEGLAYAYELARLRNDQVRARRYRRAIQWALTNAVGLQLTERDSAILVSPHRSLGAFRTRARSVSIRIDNTQHMLDALRKILAVWETPASSQGRQP